MRDSSPYDWHDFRRVAPRVHVAASCLEVEDHRERTGLVVDLSPRGARLERPYIGGPTPSEVYLEIIVPEIDEIIVARGEPCFDEVRAPLLASLGGPLGMIRRTGYRIVDACTRDLRLLKEFVFELRRLRRHEDGVFDELLTASCYAHA
jgi:hypothetical protein